MDLPRGTCGVGMGVQDVPSVPTLGWRGGDGARGEPRAVLALGSAPVILWELCQGIPRELCQRVHGISAHVSPPRAALGAG